MINDLTREQLAKRLRYDAESGDFFWIQNRYSNRIGSVAGYVDGRGCGHISLDGRLYKAHRLAWLYTYGRWPAGQIDHKDRDPGNNAIVNLREATVPQNQANKGPLSNNTSGIKGVSWHRRDRRWCACIRVCGRRLNLGSFTTIEDAAAAYAEAAAEHHGEFARIC